MTSTMISMSLEVLKMGGHVVTEFSRDFESKTITFMGELKGMETVSSSSEVSAADRALGVPRVGVGVVVLNHKDEILIGKRKSPHGQGIHILHSLVRIR